MASFWVVVPSFESVDLQARYKNRELGGAEDVHIVIDEVTAKNDADAAGLMASYVSGETNGVYQPMFTQDVSSSNLEDGRRHDRPAILFGLYSNRWLSDHWAMRRNRQIDCPIYGFDDGSQRGFLARTGGEDEAYYIDFLPESMDGSRIENFLDGHSPRMAFDYLAIARLANSQLPETPWPWVLVTSIGPFGVRSALRHLVEQGVLTTVVAAHRHHQEFIVVFRVFLEAQETAPPQLIHEWPSTAAATRATHKRNGKNLDRLHDGDEP